MSPPPGKRPGTTVQETGQSSVPVWKSAENLATPVVRTPNRPVRRYTDCAIRAVRETQYEREKCTHTQYLYRTGHCKAGGINVGMRQQRRRPHFGEQPVHTARFETVTPMFETTMRSQTIRTCYDASTRVPS